VLRMAVEAADESGELEEAMALAELALAAAGEPEIQAIVLERRSRIRRRLGIGGARDDLEAALALVPAVSGLRARLLGDLAQRLRQESDHAGAMRVATQAQELAERVGDRYAAVHAALIRATLGADSGRFHDLREAARRIGEPTLTIRSHLEEAEALIRTGRPREGARVAREGLPLAQEMGQARTLGVRLAGTLAAALWCVGQWDEALEVLENAIAQHPARGDLAALEAVQGEIHCARGDVEAAAALVDAKGHYDVIDEHFPQARLATAIRIAQGRDEEALDIAQAALAAPAAVREPHFTWPLLVLAATAARAIGLRSGRAAGARLADLAARLPALTADTRAYQATYARLVADTDSRNEAREAELAAWEETGWPHPLAWALVGAAEAALGRRDRATAVARLRRATELGTALRATPLLDEAAATARRARLELVPDPVVQAEPSVAARLGLTERELEVLELVAAGRTNRQIGEHLFISAKTASVHVSHILAKLDVTTRGEAAATAHRLRLVDPPDS
jgi:DNA-binding CsgD family transcriptional regulator